MTTLYFMFDPTTQWNKVSAIRAVRKYEGMGLKEAKDFVERVQGERGLRRESLMALTPDELCSYSQELSMSGIKMSFNVITRDRIKEWINESIEAHEYGLAQCLIDYMKSRYETRHSSVAQLAEQSTDNR